MAQFHMAGAVEKRADTLGTFKHWCVEATSGRWYNQHVRSPTPRPKSTRRGLLMGGAVTYSQSRCRHQALLLHSSTAERIRKMTYWSA